MPFKDGKWIPPEKDWERVRGKEVQPAKPTTYKSPNGADILRTDFTNFGLNDLLNASKEVARKSKQFTPTPAPSYTRSPAATPSPVDKVSSNRYVGNLHGVFDLEKALYGDKQTQPTNTPHPALKSVIDFETLTNNGNPIHRDPIPVSQVNPEKRAPKTGYDMLKELLGVNETPFDSIAETLKPLGDTNFIKNTNAVANEFSQGVAQSSGLNDLLSWYDKNGVLKDTQNQMHEHNLEDISKGAAGASNFGGQIAGLLPATVGAAATGGRLLEKVGEKIFSKAPKWLKRLGVGATAGAGTGATLATGQELLQSNNDQSLGEHLGDIGQNAAYFAAYGAASPVAGKILDSIGSKLGTTLPAGAKDALSAIGNKAPILPMIGRGVAEGGLTGSMVGGGMALGTLATTGDPNKALDVLTGEAGSEMKENFVEAIAFGIIRQLGGKGVHVNPQAAQEEAANVIMEQFPPSVRAKLEMMVEQAKIQGVDDVQAKAQVIDIMGSLPDGKDILEKASAQILQDMQALEEAQIEGDVSTKPAATIESNPIEQPSHEKDPEWNRLENEITDAIKEDDYKKAEVLHKNQLEVEKKLGFDRPNRPPSKQEEMASKLAEFFGEADGPAQVDNEVMAPQENKNHPKPRNLHAEWSRLEAQIEEADLREDQELVETLQAEQAEIDKLMEAEEDKSKPPATPSKPPETSKVETPTTGKQSVKAVKGDTVKLKGKPNDTFEVVDIDKTKVTLKSKQGTEFVAGSGAIASIVNDPAEEVDIPSTKESDPELNIIKTKSLQSGKEELTVSLTDFPEHRVKLIPSEINGTYIARYQDLQKVVNNKDEAIQWAKDRLNETQVEKVSNLETGKKIKLTMYQGRGASLEDIYGKDAVEAGHAVPILGKGDYYTFNSNDAANYGDVTSKEVRLNNPIVIYSGKQFRDLLEKADALHLDSQDEHFYKEPNKIPQATQKLQDYLKGLGHDGAVIQVGNDKRLNESFGHDQVVVFDKSEITKSINVTGFHASHKDVAEFIDRDIKSYNSIGTWFTDSLDRANELYGPKVTEATISLSNPFYPTSDNFDDFFYIAEIARKYGVDKKPDEKSMNELLNNPEYIGEFKKFYQDKGYDGIVFKDSLIDLNTNGSEGVHTVYIVFNAKDIKKVNSGDKPLTEVQNESNNDTVEANKPTFAKGNKVTWTDRSGKTLTGTIRSIDTRDNYADIDTDQIATYGGGVPIGRIELVSLSMLSLVEQPKKVESTESTSKQASKEKVTIGPVLNDHHAKMKERAERAKQRIKDKYGPGGTTLNSGFPPDLMIDFSIIGYTKILDGLADFKSWSESMMKDADGLVSNSNRIRKWLPGIYTMSKQIAESDDPDSLMDEFLVDAYGENPETKNEVPATKGKTIKLFHGSDKTFDKFRSGSAQAGKGIFFTDNAESAKEYGKNIYIVEVEAKKIANDDDWRKTVEEIDEEFLAERRKIEEDFDNDLISESEMDKMLDRSHSEWLIGENADTKQNAMVSDRLKKKGFDIYQGDMQSGDPGKEYIVLDDSIIKSVIKGGTNDVTQPLRDNGKGPLEETPSKDVQGSSSNRANTSSSAAGAGKNNRNADKDTSSTDREGSVTGTSEQSAEDRLHDTEAGPSVGDGQGDIHSPAKRRGSAKSGTNASTVSGEQSRVEHAEPRRDFVINDELDNLGGAKSRFKTNVEAIRILSLIEKEGRISTPEEQAQLSKYVGWGGLAQAFDSKNENWDKEYQTLQSLVQDGVITKDEYDTARRSTQYAHYTTKEVVNTMYQIVQRMGFKGGKILEPAMGTGNFFGMMPSDMTGLSSRTGVEMDPLSGRIAKQLYQKANIHIKGFEEYKVSDGYFDMAIGNPPFSGEVKISYNKKRENLHNFFFLQSLDKVRDGGIVAFVTSSGTMNSESGARVRKLIAGKANFLGAVRLPGDAFKKNAGTEVTTDIIFLQKRPKGEQEAHVSAFIETRPFKVGENTFDNNEYFIDHPDRVLGEYVEDKLYQGRIGVKSDGRNLEDSLTALIQKFPSNIYEERSTKAQKDPIFQEVSFDKMHELHDGAYAVSPGGEVIQRVGDQMLTTGLSGLKAKRIANMVPIRDQARTVIRLMLNNVEDSQLKEAQSKLNKLYDEFIDNYGLLTDSANVSVFSPDSLGAGVLMSLEKKNKNGEMVKEAIFHERTISGQSQTSNVETAEESLVVSLFETGRLDFKRMAELSGKKEDQLIEELQGKIFHDPSTRQWVTEDEYLSGNVRVKLHQAEVSPDSKHANNVEALKAVQPDDLMADEIFVKLGAPWVSAEDYHDFISEFLEFDRDLIKVSYNPIISKYTIVQTRGSYVLSQNFKNTDEYGVKSETLNMDKTAIDIIEDFMNGRSTVFTRIYRDGSKESDDIATNAAKRMQAQINDIFKSWVWEDVTRADRLVSKYNWELNNSRLRDYNGELIYGKAEDFVKLPGSTIALRKHQINAVWRVVQGGNTLLAHVVGSGKTYTVISAAMEMKRLGLVNKSAVVVPNHLIAQWRSDFLKAYPNSNVLVISTDDIPPVTTRKSKGMSDKDFVIKQNKQRSERAAALSKIAVGNYDAVLISHQTFGRLPVSSELVQQHIKDQIAEVRYAMEMAAIDDPKGKTVKDLEKTLESLEKKLKENLSNDNKDIAIPFEELGIDQIFVDEAHMFKNLKFHTKMRNVSSLPQTNSMRAQDMYLKTQYLSNLRGNKGIVFATGTPISNTVSEMYTIQRYLGMSELKNLGMSHFDAWAATFGNIVTDFEMNAAGQYKQKTRFSEFNNVPELMNLFESFTDIKTAGMLDLPKPANLKYETIIVEMSPDQKDYMKELLDRAENMKNVSPEVDNFLKLTGDGRKAALDIRLVRPDITKDFPDSKINAAVNNMVRIYNDPNLAKDKSGDPVKNPAQLVFLDMGTPKKKNETDESQDERKEDDEDAVNVSTYADIKKKLIAQGIPADEIAFIHEANTDKRKETLFAKVRSGEIRFLLGSTEKMGAGMNVQERLIALHHIDAPWRPSDVEQREGRINRQGNENDSIYIYQYTTKGSFDKLMWDILTRKSFMIEQVMSGETKSRTLEDMEPMVFRFAEVAAATADNPIFIEKQKIDKNVSELEGEKTQFERKRSGLKRDLANFPGSIKEFKRIIASAKDDLARAMSIPKKDQIMIVKGKRYEIEGAKSVSVVQEEVGAVLIDEYNLADKNLNRGEKATLGSFGGFDIVFKKGYGVFLSGKREHDGGINEESPTGTYSRIRHAFENVVENSQTNINYYQDLIKKLEVDIIEVGRLLEAKFEKSEELQAAVNRQFEITQELIALNTQHDQAAQETEDESEDEFAFATSPVEGKPTAKKGPNSKKTEPPIDDPAQPIIDMSAIAHMSPKVVREVADMVAKFLGTSIRDGHVRSGAEGIFNSKTGTGAVRNRSYHEWRVVGHELGHTFSYRYGGWKGFKSELERLAAKTYPGKIPKGKEAEEGFAEFFFIWTVDPIKAAEVTPITSASFEDFIGSNKDLAEFFIKVRTIIDNDLTGSPYEKAMGAISSEINPDSEVYGGEYRVPWYKRGVFRVLDYTIPAKDLMKNVEDPNKHVDLSHLLAISGDAKAKALLSFESTPRDHEGRFIEGRSLLTISEEAIQIIGKKIKWKVTKLKAINEDMGALEIFSTIMLAKRVKERIGKGFQKLPLTEIEADNVLVQATKDFPEAMKLADEYAINFSNLMLEKLERADIITPETRKIINAGSHSYMAFYYDERKRPVTSGRGESGKTNRNPVKRFTGKSAPVLNFFQATMLKLTEVEQAIEYKRALNTLQDILSEKDMGMFGVKIPAPTKVQTLNLEQVMEAVKGMMDDDVSMENISDDRAIKIFMAGGFDQISKSEPIVMNIREGKPTFMRLSPDLFKTFMAMKPVQIEGLAKGLAWTSRVIRFTALSTIRYITNAVVRDFSGALIQSKAPVHSLLKEFYQSASATIGLNKEVYNSYVASGGHSGAAENMLKDMVRNTFDEGIIRTSAAGWGKVKMGSKTVMVRVIRTPSEALRVIEEGPRIAEYIAVWKNQVKDLGFDAEQMWKVFTKEGTDALPAALQNRMEKIIVESSYASREVTTNFGLHGESEWTRKYMQTVTFLHGTTQGMYRFTRQVKDNPKRVMIGVGVLSAVSIAAWMLMNDDDDDKRNLQDMDSAARDRYWWVPIPGSGMYYAISKPFEYTFPANFLERYLDHAYSNDPDARKPMEDYRVAIVDSFGLHPINPFLNTWMELQSNIAWHGGNIVPLSEQNIAKDMQAGPDTSSAAKFIAKPINMIARLFADSTADPTVGVSPRKVDYFIKQMTGRYGSGILDIIDYVKAKVSGEESKGISGTEYAPAIGAIFYSQAEGSSRIVEKFYNNYKKTQTLSQSSGKMMNEGLTSIPFFATEENIKMIRYLPAMTSIANELSAIRKDFKGFQEGATPEVRRRITMQQDFIEKLAAGLMYGVPPASPHPDAEITDELIQTISDRLIAKAQQAIINEKKRKGGATEQADYLQQLIDQKNSK